jgi:hypothetical protein
MPNSPVFFCYDTGMSESKEPMSEPKEPSATVALTRALLHLKMHRNALEQVIWAMRKQSEFVGVKDEAALAFGVRAATFALREFDEDETFKAAVSEMLTLTQLNSSESRHQPSASK